MGKQQGGFERVTFGLSSIVQESFTFLVSLKEFPVTLMSYAIKKQATIFRHQRVSPVEEYTLQVDGKCEYIYGQHPLFQFQVCLLPPLRGKTPSS